MTANDITCRRCIAQPGNPCWIDGSNPNAKQICYHPERISDAAAMTRVADPVSKADFDQAVEEAIGGVL